VAEPAWTEIARGVAAIFQVLGIAVGGTWAYLKFVHGRTLVQRAELHVAGVLVRNDESTAVVVTASMQNTGAARIDLLSKAVYLYGAEPAFWSHEANMDWDCRLSEARGSDDRPETGAIRATEVFAPHVRLEPNEAISDSVLIPVPRRVLEDDDQWLAYKLELVVFAFPDSRLLRPRSRARERPSNEARDSRGATVKRWSAASVVPGTLRVVEGAQQEQTKHEEATNAVVDDRR
jgi:hypothetical protein